MVIYAPPAIQKILVRDTEASGIPGMMMPQNIGAGQCAPGPWQHRPQRIAGYLCEFNLAV